jgi:hypothetical protein
MPCDHIAAGAMHFESNEGCKHSLRHKEKRLRDSTIVERSPTSPVKPASDRDSKLAQTAHHSANNLI